MAAVWGVILLSIFRLIYPIHLLFVFFIRLQLGERPASQPTSWCCTQSAGLLIKQQTGTMVSSLYENGPSKTRGKKVEWKFVFFFFFEIFNRKKIVLCGTRIILSLSLSLFCVRSSIVFSPLDVCCAVCVCVLYLGNSLVEGNTPGPDTISHSCVFVSSGTHPPLPTFKSWCLRALRNTQRQATRPQTPALFRI